MLKCGEGKLRKVFTAGCKLLQEGRRNGAELDPQSLFPLRLAGLALAAVPSREFGFIYMRLILGYLCQAYVYSL